MKNHPLRTSEIQHQLMDQSLADHTSQTQTQPLAPPWASRPLRPQPPRAGHHRGRRRRRRVLQHRQHRPRHHHHHHQEHTLAQPRPAVGSLEARRGGGGGRGRGGRGVGRGAFRRALPCVPTPQRRRPTPRLGAQARPHRPGASHLTHTHHPLPQTELASSLFSHSEVCVFDGGQGKAVAVFSEPIRRQHENDKTTRTTAWDPASLAFTRRLRTLHAVSPRWSLTPASSRWNRWRLSLRGRLRGAPQRFGKHVRRRPYRRR